MAPERNQRITTVGIFHSPHIPLAAAQAQDIAHVLRQLEITVWESGQLDQADVAQRMSETDLLVTLGGDGSILHAARVAAGSSALIFGINLGRIGFLTEAEPEDWQHILPPLLEGDYWVEERMMLRAEVQRGETLWSQGDALNDVVVSRGALAKIVHLEVYVDGDLLTTYVADGLITATPTGSTAYALAAGGPIMPPQQRNILLVPIAPHLSLGRAVVLAEGVQVQMVVGGRSPAALTLDGKTMTELVTGDLVRVGASSHVARFARVRERDYFYRTLMARLVPREREQIQKPNDHDSEFNAEDMEVE